MREFFRWSFPFIFVSVKAEDEGSDGSCGAGEGASDQDNFTEEDSEQEEEEESNEATDVLFSLNFLFSIIFIFSLIVIFSLIFIFSLVWSLVSLSPFPFLNPYFTPPIFPLLVSFPLSRHSLSPVSLFPWWPLFQGRRRIWQGQDNALGGPLAPAAAATFHHRTSHPNIPGASSMKLWGCWHEKK